MRWILAIALASALMACDKPAAMSPNETYARNRGKADAQVVIKARPGSMEQERALLNIHATHYKIEQTGDTLAARIYLKAATASLDSAGILK